MLREGGFGYLRQKCPPCSMPEIRSSNKVVGYALKMWHKLRRTKLPDSNGSKMCRDCLVSLERVQSSTQFRHIQLQRRHPHLTVRVRQCASVNLAVVCGKDFSLLEGREDVAFGTPELNSRVPCLGCKGTYTLEEGAGVLLVGMLLKFVQSTLEPGTTGLTTGLTEVSMGLAEFDEVKPCLPVRLVACLQSR